ncbi:MAG: hypothetical protein HOE11_03290 [Candidatus Diapherotrites archaeon]|jgi:hypothetical protein|nr:hypothetical protein [Candidatus Diapherotrites archaeon]MBT4596922.1 hypothetical protein [Candidatus Diapherotrites archaeon]
MEELAWNEKLSKEDVLLIKLIGSYATQKIFDFVVLYYTIESGHHKEIIKFDGSLKEHIHVHKYYLPRKQKQYLDKAFSFATIEEFKLDIEKNWIKYKLKFKQKN